MLILEGNGLKGSESGTMHTNKEEMSRQRRVEIFFLIITVSLIIV